MHTLSAIDLHQEFLKGTYTAVEIASYFLARIKERNPKIGAFLRTLDERVLEKAFQLDEKKKRGEKLGKLAAIPIAIKDNIHIKGELTTCGSNFLTNYTAPFSATAVELLEKEDALLIGKTNMDEFAMGSSNEHSAFYPVKNPLDLTRSPGGSSGGSAAAVAGYLVPCALGSDTGGSIRQPASLCGIVGYKPSYGRISRYGLVAFGSSLDQIGPLTRTTEDAALLMEVLGQHCERDATSLPLEKEAILYSLKESIQGKKIAVPFDFLKDLNKDSKENFDKAMDVFKSLGAEIIDVDLSLIKYAIPVYYILATAEASTNLARFDGIRYGQRSKRAKTLSEVYKFSKEEGFGKEVKRRILLGTFVLSSGYKDAYYKKAQQVRTLIIESFKKVFETADAVLLPTTTGPAFKLGEIQDPIQMYLEDLYTVPSNLAGIPAIAVPSGLSKEGLPLGIQLYGAFKKGKDLFKLAHAFTHAHPVPLKETL
jgi:aspartyl-tRNA(Asn)/glutamyl-tRNA(Gln) amidotransferase subunit A